MAKKRAAYTTKGRKSRVPVLARTPAKATDPAPGKKPPAPKAPEVPKAPKAPKASPAKFTLEEALAWFRKNPHKEAFFCDGPAGFAIAKGDLYVQFKKGELETSDPAAVEVLMRAREYNTTIHAINPVLRNLKKG